MIVFFIKVGYYEKATKFEKIAHLIFTLLKGHLILKCLFGVSSILPKNKSST